MREEFNYNFAQKTHKFYRKGEVIHCLNVRLLRNYMKYDYRIKHRYFNNCTRREQRQVVKAIKQARMLGLLPYKH